MKEEINCLFCQKMDQALEEMAPIFEKYGMTSPDVLLVMQLGGCIRTKIPDNKKIVIETQISILHKLQQWAASGEMEDILVKDGQIVVKDEPPIGEEAKKKYISERVSKYLNYVGKVVKKND
jgi:hypothetical protein